MPEARAPATLLTTEVQVGGRPQRAIRQLTPQTLIHADAVAARRAQQKRFCHHPPEPAISVPPENRLHSTPGRTPPIRGSPPPFCGRLLKRFVSAPVKSTNALLTQITQRSGASIGRRDNTCRSMSTGALIRWDPEIGPRTTVTHSPLLEHRSFRAFLQQPPARPTASGYSRLHLVSGITPPHPPLDHSALQCRQASPPLQGALTRPSTADRRRPMVEGATADSPPKRPGPAVRARDAGEPSA